MEKNKNISFIQLESYTRPEIKESQRFDYVEYGDDNNYFEYLIDLYSDSATNNAIINSAIQIIYGDGIAAKNENTGDWDKFIEMVKPEDLRKIVSDFKMLGMCSFQVTYTPKRDKVLKMEHFPVNTLRAETANDDGEIEAYYYAFDWENVRRMDDVTRIPAFGFGSGKDTEILYIKPYIPSYFYYAPVDYHGCLQYCQLEAELSNFHINNVLNGFMPAALINMNNGEPESDEAKRDIERKIQQKFSGTSNAGKFILSFNDSKETAAEIVPVNLADAHSQYDYVSTEAKEKIITAHRVTSPKLLGITDASGFSSNADEIIVAAMHYEKTVLEPFRRMIIGGINLVQEINGTDFELYFKSLYEPKEDVEEDVADIKDEAEEAVDVEQQEQNKDVI